MARLRKQKEPAAGCVVMEDCKPSRCSRLRFRLLVFERQRDLRAYWRETIHGTLGRACRGAVHDLVERRERHDGRRWRSRTIRDRRIFCIIGLLRSHLTMRIITHEAVHAAFAYARRVGRRSYAREFLDNEEEAICYPAGDIGRAIVDVLARYKMI